MATNISINVANPGTGAPVDAVQDSVDGVTVDRQSVTPHAGSQVGLVTPPATLASGDNALTFAISVRHIEIQNNATISIGVEHDAVASAGSWQIAPGERYFMGALTHVLHLYAPSAGVNLNGTAAGNIVVRGRV